MNILPLLSQILQIGFMISGNTSLGKGFSCIIEFHGHISFGQHFIPVT